MKCLILAAGYATRLYPLTENFPKPLLKVGDKTILDWLLDDIDKSGIVSEYIVISNHKFAGHFEKWASEKPLNSIPPSVSNETAAPQSYGLGGQMVIKVLDDGTVSNETRLGAVKDIEFAIDGLSLDEDLLVIAGDNVLDFSLCSFLDYYKTKNVSCVMRYFEADKKRLTKSGVLKIGDNDLVTEMVEKSPNPPSNWCCPPFYIYAKDDVKKVKEAIEEGCNTDAPGSFISWLCRKSSVYAMEMPGKRYDIGNLESYEQVQKEYKGIIK